MSRNFKIIVLVLIVGALFFIAKFFHFRPFAYEICPPDKCEIYKTGPNGQVSGILFPKEEGLRHDNFAPLPPPGLPAGIPIDPKPIRIVSSYEENMRGDKASGEKPHIQTTYSYITSQQAIKISENFENYLNKNGYNATFKKENSSQLAYALYGRKALNDKAYGQLDQSITVTVATQNQFENIVSISVIISDITKNQ